MDLRAEPDLTMTIYAAEPGSPTEDALRLLASWAATTQEQDPAPTVRPLDPTKAAATMPTGRADRH